MKRCPRCQEMLDRSEFSPGNHRCRPCVAEYSRERRAMKSTRRVVEQRAVPLGLEFSIFMAACAVGGGDANVPPMVRSVSIETINHTAAMQ